MSDHRLPRVTVRRVEVREIVSEALFNLVKWPRLPIEDFWRWLYEGGKI